MRFLCSPEDETHSAISLNTSASDGVVLDPNLLYHNCYVFVIDFVTSVYCFSMKANQYILIVCLTVFFSLRCMCTVLQVFGLQQISSISFIF
jgi:hypothetical protein